MKVTQSQLCWRGTFLDLKDEGMESEKSPRASSDPGSECSSNAFHFVEEKKSVEMFSQRMQHVWLGSKFRKQSCSSSSNDGAVGVSEALSDRMLDSVCDVHSIGSRFSDEPKNQAIHRDSDSDNDASVYNSDLSDQLSSALCVVDSIPEQVREILQQRAQILADDVQGEVADVRKMIWDTETSEAGAEEAIERLEVIPELIRKSFGASLAKMKASVKKRVDGVIKRLDHSDLAHDQIASQLWSIPEEILQIAEEAVGEAVQESQAQATQQLAFALESAPKTVAANHMALQQAKHQIISHMPQLPVTPQEARTAATDTIEHAVAVARDEVAGASASTNQNVADALLRAKQGAKVQSLGGEEPCQPHVALKSRAPVSLPSVGSRETSSMHLPNPGSIGHPEYCPRACLFFPLGKCSNGNQCAFCHLPHAKRPTHLDKRHREMLKLMSFSECAALVVPIMRAKALTMNMGQEMLGLIEALSISQVGGRSEAVPKNMRILERALQVLPFRTLTTILRRAVPDNTSECVMVDGIMLHIRGPSEMEEYPSINV